MLKNRITSFSHHKSCISSESLYLFAKCHITLSRTDRQADPIRPKIGNTSKNAVVPQKVSANVRGDKYPLVFEHVGTDVGVKCQCLV